MSQVGLGVLGAKRMVRELMRSNDLLGEISDLQWASVYHELGLSAAFQKFASSRQWRPSKIDWSVPIVQGLQLNHVVELHREFNGFINQPNLFVEMEHVRDPMRDGSYQVDFRRMFEADPPLADYLTVRELLGRKFVGCTILEYSLLNLALRLTRDRTLDRAGSVTLCSGTTCNGGTTMLTFESTEDGEGSEDNEDNKDNGQIYIGSCSLDSSYRSLRIREVNIPILH